MTVRVKRNAGASGIAGAGLRVSRSWPRHGRRDRGNGGYDTNHQLGRGLVANFIPGA
jgi:hypothetical protein